jgi:signal transduction histidine kinase
LIPQSLPALILNVEDNGPKRYLKTRALAGAGFEVLEAADAATARALVRERRPDLVLLDVRLPDGDGRDLCAWIKGSEETAQIAVIQTSALLVDSHERVASLDAGADGYLAEPLEPGELIAHVRALLRVREAERERQAAMAALQEADRRKDEFLAMLAHELRNPLAPIRNAVEILKSEDPALRERARTIVSRQVSHLARLVDDLLEVSRITQRKVVVKRAPVTLRSVIDSAIETARPFVDANRHALAVSIPDEDVWLEIDAVRIAQAIGNLLNNAAKFTPRGGRIRLGARLDGAEVEIEVVDNGTGIAPELLGSVFDLFTQDDRSLERSQGGLGIGLSLVRGMVELHGGSVHAESAGRDQGSRFAVRLPLATAAARAPRRPPASAARTPRERRKRILVVEDHADCAETLRMVLQDEGHEVSVFDDGLEALACAREWRPEVVLLDLGLPGMDGYELAARLRALPELSETPLIAVSGYGQQRDRDRCAAAGFDLHLTKPVEPARLAEALESARSLAR